MKKSLPLGARLFAIIIPTFTVAILLVTLFNIYAFTSLHTQYKKLMEDRVETLASSIQILVNKNLMYFPLDYLVGMNQYLEGFVGQNTDISYCFIANHDGQIIYHNIESELNKQLDRSLYHQILTSQTFTNLFLSIGEYYELVIPIIKDDNVIGTIHFGLKKELLDSKISRLIVISVIVLALSLLFSISLLYVILQRSVITPIKNLAIKASFISEHRDLNYQIEYDRSDEIGSLSASFNSMLSSLREFFAQIQAEIAERKKAEEDLRRLNEELERRVLERTKALREGEQRLHSIIDGSPIPAFVIGKNHRVIYWNKALEEMSRIKSEEVVGTSEHWKSFYNEERPCMADLLVDEAVELVTQWYSAKYIKSPLIEDAYEATDFFPALGEDGKWLRITAAAIRDSQGMIAAAVETLEDITERKSAEKRIDEALQFNQTILSASPVAILTYNSSGQCVSANEAASKITGGTIEELLAQNFRQLESWKRAGMIDAAENALKTGQVKVLETNIATTFGKDLWFDCLFTPFHHEGELHLLVLVSDVTWRKQAEDALRESEEKYRNILSSIEDGYHEVDLKGNFTFVSSSMVNILGYEESELLGMNYRKYMGELDAKNVFKSYNEVYRTGIPSKHTGWEFIRKDGTKIAAEGSVSLVKSKDQVIGFRGIIRDVTDKKKAEDALRKSEEKYRTLLNNIEDGCYELDPAGNFTFVNPSMTRILGYSEEELIGMNNRQYTDKENARKVFQAFNMVYKTGAPTRHLGWELIRKDGTKAFVGCSVSLIKDSSDNPIGFRGVLNDITERKQMEEEIRALSLTDPLTGLHNRRGFMSLAEQQLKIAARTKIGLLLLFADLDGMKWINDNLGHKKGDETLIEAANVLKQVFREADIVARIGGDEFSVLAVGINMEDSRIIEDRLQYQIGINNSRENREYSLSMSVGMAYNDPENPSTIDELMSHADVLMYEQKKNKHS